MKEKKKRKPLGINITVSKEAYEKIYGSAIRSIPRRTLREQINIINNLPPEK